MVKPVFRIVLAYPFGRRANGFFQRITGAGLGLAQPGFKFAEGQFNRVKIGGIRGGRRTFSPLPSSPPLLPALASSCSLTARAASTMT